MAAAMLKKERNRCGMSMPFSKHYAFWLFGVAILVLRAVTTGCFLRNRTVDEGDTADWLVLVELGLCAAGGGVGWRMIRRESAGIAARLLLAYCAAVAVSALFSGHLTLV